MYAMVTFIQAPEGQLDEGLELWHEHVLPVTMQRPGWKGVLSLVDRQTGRSIAVTLWETEEAMRASSRAHYHQEAVARFAPYFAQAHSPEAYEVDLCEVHEQLPLQRPELAVSG